MPKPKIPLKMTSGKKTCKLMHNAIVRSVRRIDYSMLNNSWVKGSSALKKN